VVHLAARAGVRPSLESPLLYHDVNTLGTLRILEAAATARVQRFVFASSSSVYGDSDGRPFTEDEPAERPLSPYGATKRAGEQHVAVYHRLHGLSAICLRFFTAYGPRQRPDMAIHKFARLIREGKEVPMFGDGSTAKDYTFVSDIVEGIVAAIDRPGELDIVNLGGGRPVRLDALAEGIAKRLEKPLRVKRLPLRPGDAMRSEADLSKARRILGYAPKVGFEEGLDRFVEWFRAAG
jgi:UDP-glucuronate 4-epimerase